MKKNNAFVLELKNKLGFLEDYGFILAFDPCNLNRPCYKNRYGEIVIWRNNDGLSTTNMEIYVQINGWKTAIDVKKEYKRCFNKIFCCKSLIAMFQELFEYYVLVKGEFFGLKILKDDYLIKNQEIPVEDFPNTINPFKIRRKNIIWNTTFIMIFVLLFIQLGIVISFEYIGNAQVVLGLRKVLGITVLISQLLILMLLKQKLNILSKVLMVGFPLIVIGLLYLFPRRVDYAIYIILFIILTIYLIISLLITLFNKNKDYILNGLIPFLYPTAVIFVKSFWLQDNIFFNDDTPIFLILALIIAFISVILFLILKKDKSDKKEFIGMLFTIFCSVLIIVWFIPYLAIQNINYAFDYSEGVSYNYRIMDKETRISGGHKSRTRRYYLIIIKDGNKEDLKVDCVTYKDYDINDSIELVKHKGFLGIEYYELTEDTK